MLEEGRHFIEIDTIDAVKPKSLIAYTEIKFVFTNRLGALRKNRTETLRRAGVDASVLSKVYVKPDAGDGIGRDVNCPASAALNGTKLDWNALSKCAL